MPALITYQTPVLADWVDYNGHLRDAFYLLVFSYASDDRDASGHSLFTLEAHINYLHEVKLGEDVQVRTQILGHDRKRVQLYHALFRAGSDEALAASEQMLLHVDLAAGPKSAPFGDQSLEAMRLLVQAQHDQPAPTFVGRVIGLPK
jgi:acyl-CoA thioester hydrolase